MDLKSQTADIGLIRSLTKVFTMMLGQVNVSSLALWAVKNHYVDPAHIVGVGRKTKAKAFEVNDIDISLKS